MVLILLPLKWSTCCPDERLELVANVLSDDAVEDDVDGGVDHEQEVRRAQHHVERHRHVEPVAGN